MVGCNIRIFLILKTTLVGSLFKQKVSHISRSNNHSNEQESVSSPDLKNENQSIEKNADNGVVLRRKNVSKTN